VFSRWQCHKSGFCSAASDSCSNNWEFTADSRDKFEFWDNSYSVIAIIRHSHLMLILMVVTDRFGCWLYGIIRYMQIRMTVSTNEYKIKRTAFRRINPKRGKIIMRNSIILVQNFNNRGCSLSYNEEKKLHLPEYWNQRDALFVQFIENQRSLHVSSITCSSGGAEQTAFGILRAYNVSWLWHGCSETLYAQSVPNAVWEVPPEDEQVMLETCRSPWF
jgi:hypothetical protein